MATKKTSNKHKSIEGKVVNIYNEELDEITTIIGDDLEMWEKLGYELV